MIGYLRTMIGVITFFANILSTLAYGLHFANVATRELAMAKSVGNGQAKADVRRYNFFLTYARKIAFRGRFFCAGGIV